MSVFSKLAPVGLVVGLVAGAVTCGNYQHNQREKEREAKQTAFDQRFAQDIAFVTEAMKKDSTGGLLRLAVREFNDKHGLEKMLVADMDKYDKKNNRVIRDAAPYVVQVGGYQHTTVRDKTGKKAGAWLVHAF